MKTTFFIDAKGVQTDAPVIAVKAGQSGYWPIYSRRRADVLNPKDMTPAILESAMAGSMFGWNVPAAALAMAYAYEADRKAGGAVQS